MKIYNRLLTLRSFCKRQVLIVLDGEVQAVLVGPATVIVEEHQIGSALEVDIVQQTVAVLVDAHRLSPGQQMPSCFSPILC